MFWPGEFHGLYSPWGRKESDRLKDFQSLQNNPESENIPQHAVISSRQSRHKRALVELLWLKSSPRKGRMDAMVAYLEFGGAEIKGSERRGAKLAWAVGPEKEVSSLFPRPQALPGPRQRLAPVAAPAHGDPRVVPVDLMPQLAALYLEAGPAGWDSCLENPHGQRSLAGCSPWGCKESDTTARGYCHWRRLLRIPWNAGRSNLSILKQFSPEHSLEGLMMKPTPILWPPDVKN